MALTPRQEQVADLVGQAMRNREIAEALGISEGTVKIYMRQIRRRTGCRNRVEVALMARAGREGQDRCALALGAAVPVPAP